MWKLAHKLIIVRCFQYRKETALHIVFHKFKNFYKMFTLDFSKFNSKNRLNPKAHICGNLKKKNCSTDRKKTIKDIII